MWTLWIASSIYDVDARLDPLSLAIVKGNVRIAELLVQDADNSVLSRAWPHRDLFWMRHDVEFLMTPLNLAIWAGEYGIAKLLLQRFSELDPSTLQWNEPTGLGLAAYLGDVKMARLMLDGEARPKGGTPASPWVPRFRSMLLDNRAYEAAANSDSHQNPINYLGSSPPMILAGFGSIHLCWRTGGEAMLF